jgi:hypothetical protein
MATDIIATEAWSCDFEDGCKVGWHVANYWIGGSRYTVDRYSDGDHEGIDEADIPNHEEIAASWQRYADYVSETGLDPLGEYLVPRTTKRKERYSATFRDSIVGPALVQVFRGECLPLRTLPAHVVEFLCVERANESAPWVFAGGEDNQWAALVACDVVRESNPKNAPREARITFTIEREVPRPDSVVMQELRRAARRKAGAT